MSDDQIQLSRRLCEVLERIGVSENMREMYRDTSISTEIMLTLTSRMRDMNMSKYIFGSSCEGTTTPGMGSDVDIVYCYENWPVIEDIREAPPAGRSLLAVTSRHTRPGYVKLQVVIDVAPLTNHNHNIDATDIQYDCDGRVCWKHVSRYGKDKDVNERNGPADTISGDPGVPHQDFVVAYRCKTFPHIASESLQKCIACGWVSNDEVERMMKWGVLFVGVGFQSSVDRDIEWRMSLSLQERELTLALNLTQHKCYVLLKTIKNLIIANSDVGKSLTSYHCKTCLFTVITDTSRALWIEDNLIQCTYICLRELMNWISRGYCPNFFMPDSNMFDRCEFRQAQDRLVYYMRDVLREWPRLLYHIQSDNLGDALQGLAGRQIDENRIIQVYGVLIHVCGTTCRSQYEIVEYCHNLPSSQHIAQYLFQQQRWLTSIDSITEHTPEQTRAALRQFQHIIHRLYAQHLASAAFSTEDLASRQLLLEASTRHLRQGANCDVMTGQLLEATILYRMGNIEECRDVLEQTERQLLHGAIISLCVCYPGTHYCNDYLKRSISSGYTNQHNIMESVVAPCMMFLTSQSEIIPKALQYEMYRSVCASPETRDEDDSEWYDWVVIDSKVYLYFMQYLVYTDLNQPLGQRVAIRQILKTLARDPNLKHKETAYNLLGWICIQEGQLQEAVDCLCYSWQIRPDHNAAKWHLMQLFMRLAG